MNRIQRMRAAIEKITRLLSGRSISVIQQGLEAKVTYSQSGEPRAVYVPELPDNASDQLIDAIQGFIDHEVAHILYTDSSVNRRASACGGATHNVFNAIEDTFIERKMSSDFKGAGFNIRNTQIFAIEKLFDPAFKKALAVGLDEGEMFAQVLIAPAIRAWAGQEPFERFMADKWDYIRNIVGMIGKDVIDKIPNVEASVDSLDIAADVIKRLKAKDKRKNENTDDSGAGSVKCNKSTETDKNNSEDDNSDSQQGNESDVKTGSEADSKDAENDKGKEPQDGGGGDKDSDDKDSGDKDSGGNKSEGGDSEDKDSGSKGSENEDSGEDKGSDEDKGSGGDGPDDKGSEEKDSGDKGSEEKDSGGKDSGDSNNTGDGFVEQYTPVDVDVNSIESSQDFVSKMIARDVMDSITKTKGIDKYIVWSRHYDRIAVTPNPKSARKSGERFNQKIRDKTDHMIGPISKDLERCIAARSRSFYVPGFRSGRLHSANLFKLKTGDNRVFRKKEEHTSKDVAVTLLIDASGSMKGENLDNAVYAAYGLASSLERIGIKNEVLAFTTVELSHVNSSAFGQLKADERRLPSGCAYARYQIIDMPLIKGFEERISQPVMDRFSWAMNAMRTKNNIDGESIEIAAERLAARKEEGKILIVLSDGMPTGVRVETSVVFRRMDRTINVDLPKMGIDVIGIGIDTQSVKRFYKRHVVIKKVSDLASTVMNELKPMLLNKAK